MLTTLAVIFVVSFVFKKWAQIVQFFLEWRLAKLEMEIEDCWTEADFFSEKRDEKKTLFWVEKAEIVEKKRNEYVKSYPLSLGGNRKGRA